LASIISIIQILLNNLYLVGVLALTTLGIALTFKTASVTNFAQSITATMGAYTAAYLYMRMGLPVGVAAVGGIASCFLLGLIIDAVIVRKMSSGGTGRVMITLGLIILISAFIPIIFGMVPYEFPRFLKDNINFTMFGTVFTITKNGLFTFGLAAVVIAIIFLALNMTKWGLGVRATAANATVSSMLGINTHFITAMSWAISSACGALAAILYAAQTTNVSSDMLGSIQSTSLLAFVMGGYTSFYGPVIGAVLIPVATALLAMISGLWANVFLYVLVLLTILIKPMGIFGKKTVEKV